MEKRLPIAMVLNLTAAESPDETELTYTDNVSAHGAWVFSNHPWQAGEIAEVTSLLDQLAMRGKVAHCRRCGEDRYAIGLSLPNGDLAWSTYLKDATRPRQALRPRIAR